MRFFERSRQPRRIGAFEIVEKIGEGGMCTVYRARQASLDHPVAVKVLKGKLGNNPEVRERFERESLIVARLNHPNIIHVVDRGITADGAPYFVMEYLEGTDLAQALARGPLDRTHKIEIAIQVCRALAYAHKNGVIHRDIKPANILLDLEGNAIVLDFGIAKLVGPAATDETRADLVLGTLAYMSPEQQTGHPSRPRAEISASCGKRFDRRLPPRRSAPPPPTHPERPPTGLTEFWAPAQIEVYAGRRDARDRTHVDLERGANPC